MHLFLIKPLVRDLATERLTEKESFKYFLADTLLINFNLYLALWWANGVSSLLYFEFLFLTVLAIFGCVMAFGANGGSGGKDFVLRALCLCVPITVRVTLAGMLFSVVLQIFGPTVFSAPTFSDPMRTWIVVSNVGFIVISIYFWLALWWAISEIREIEKAT